MISVEQALLRAILTNSDDDLPRLVLADWLDEHGGDPDRAEFIRVQCELASIDIEMARCRHQGRKPHGLEFGGPLRGQVPAGRLDLLRWRERQLWTNHERSLVGLPACCDEWLVRTTSDDRPPAASAPLAVVHRGFVAEITLPVMEFIGDERPCPNADGAIMDHTTGAWECCRQCDHTGFIGVEGVAGALFAAHPIERVNLTDAVNREVRGRVVMLVIYRNELGPLWDLIPAGDGRDELVFPESKWLSLANTLFHAARTWGRGQANL